MAETNYPLLVFPEPAQAERARRFGGGGRPKIPDAASQSTRLEPQFQRLQDAMDRQGIQLQDNPLGIVPEQVLVLETVGRIQDFIKAVRKIAGLEWLGEHELEDIEPGYGFEDEAKPEKALKGQLFLVMTNQQALSQLQSLFKKWKRDPETSFRTGLAPLKEAFRHLYTIRPWGPEDRIKETGVLNDWKCRVQQGEDQVRFEAELWFRKDDTRRQQAQSELQRIIESHKGQVIAQCVIPKIAYHSILGRMPITDLQAVIDNPDQASSIRLLQCEDLMYVRPIGQCSIPGSDDTETTPLTNEELAMKTKLPDGDPVVALLDGLPLTGHKLLQQRIVVDDPDNYESTYQAHERAHGTAMASLICYGDLNQPGDNARIPLYARPILQPRRGFNGQFQENIPEDVLPVDIIHRSVRRLFDGESGEPPAAPTVRIINLSVCDSYRPFLREMSAWARLLDWLAWKYNVLFIVSSGNHGHNIELSNVSRATFEGLSEVERENAIIKALAEDTRNRRLLSPGESLNSITVGASHADAAPPPPNQGLIDPFSRPGLPSVVSAHGPGYRRAIKPDIFLPGGRQFVSDKIGNAHPNATLEIKDFKSPPGLRVASPGNPGQMNRTIYTRGTSNATALTSRGAAALLGFIGELRDNRGQPVLEKNHVVLVKALLVHGTTWAESEDRYETALKTPENSRTFKEYLGRFLGYGSADIGKVANCTEQRVTVLGYGELNDGEASIFQFPLPPSLSAQTTRRRLTITLAWLSPINGTRQSYRVAHLWFDARNDLASTRQFADHRAVQRGTVQHEVFEGHQALDFQDGDAIKIRVNCRADAGDIPDSIPYGLAVTLEVTENLLLPVSIYEEVRERLAVRVPVQGGQGV
ncbi:MAG: S8 family peptidase [Synechococcus sp. SB0678_bin_12]|nr:S8 family peptidase [Synechococcus sp. SB0678_bin_12]MYI87682.1 S8 family peptidase [Synechococcus sp. SB0672_bin_10]